MQTPASLRIDNYPNLGEQIIGMMAPTGRQIVPLPVELPQELPTADPMVLRWQSMDLTLRLILTELRQIRTDAIVREQGRWSVRLETWVRKVWARLAGA